MAYFHLAEGILLAGGPAAARIDAVKTVAARMLRLAPPFRPSSSDVPEKGDISRWQTMLYGPAAIGVTGEVLGSLDYQLEAESLHFFIVVQKQKIVELLPDCCQCFVGSKPVSVPEILAFYLLFFRIDVAERFKCVFTVNS